MSIHVSLSVPVNLVFTIKKTLLELGFLTFFMGCMGVKSWPHQFCGHDLHFKAAGGHLKTFVDKLFKVLHRVPGGKISATSTFCSHGLHFKVAGGGYV